MKPIKSIRKLALALAMVAMSSGLAMATGTNSGVLTVSAFITDQCQIGNSSLNFGQFTPGTALPGTTTLSVVCTSGTTASIYSQTALSSRTMTRQTVSGKTTSGTLTYHLYASPADQTALNDLSADGSTLGLLAYTGTGQTTTPTLYANIASTETGVAGIYYGVADLTISY